MTASTPDHFRLWAGALPEPGVLPAEHASTCDTVQPVRRGFLERDGTRVAYAVWGERGPWIAFAPPFQIAHSRTFRANLPYLSDHYRVVTLDGRGNGHSDRPDDPSLYRFDQSYNDLVELLDVLHVDRVALIGVSAASMTVVRYAAEHPGRVSHLLLCGGTPDMLLTEENRPAIESGLKQMQEDWPAYLDAFMTSCLPEPWSSKAYEDGLRHAWATDSVTLMRCRLGWMGADASAWARRVTCPTLILHGDLDNRVPIARGHTLAAQIPGSSMITLEGCGHVLWARDPIFFNRTVRNFVGGAADRSTWVRARNRRRRALFLSSPIGLGHVQRDLAIAKRLRALHGDIEIDWLTTDPAARYLRQEGERLHPACERLASESRHFESVAGEHDLHAFFAVRTMDELMVRNFMVFSDVVDAEHHDLVIGDEAWDVDHFYHANPELKRQPFVFLTDFVGCLPVNPEDERETTLCAEHNAQLLEQVARYPHVRDMALFIGNRDDVVEDPFGPGLPGIRDWTDRNFCYCGYCLPFDPADLADTERLRHRHGYRPDEKVVIASVGGTAAGRHLLHRIAAAFPRMKSQVPELRMILVTGPRLPTDGFVEQPGLEVRPYLHHLYEHLAGCDLALVQGGLTTCMELVATGRRFLSFPLRNHFEQCIHVRRRLFNYDADNSVDLTDLGPDDLADRALRALEQPVRYRPVEVDGADRAARRLAQVLENRWWAG